MYDVVLIGCGNIGEEYIKSLIKLNIKFLVIGNTYDKCENLKNKYNINIISGGIENFLFNFEPKYIIIATPINLLDKHLEICLKSGAKNILLEKPGSIYLEKMEKIIDKYPDRNIIVGYNRRFFPAIIKAKKIIDDDNGALSFQLSINESILALDKNKYHQDILDNWIYSMTSHIIDIAFYLCGNPKHIHCLNSGKNMIKNCSKASVFTGCGITEKNALFSYHGNWNITGRWKLEIYTKNYMVLLYPLEKLYIRQKGDPELIEIDLTIDKEIKEGIFLQTKEFIENSGSSKLLSYKDQYLRMKNYFYKIFN